MGKFNDKIIVTLHREEISVIDEEGRVLKESDIGNGFRDTLEDEAIRVFKGW